MEDILVPIFGIMFTFGAPAIVLWQLLATRHKERLTIIERGLDPAQYAVLYARKASVSDPLRSLKWGLLIGFLGGGLWLGSWMVQVYNFPDPTMGAMMLIGGGLALFLYYWIASRSAKNTDK